MAGDGSAPEIDSTAVRDATAPDERAVLRSVRAPPFGVEDLSFDAGFVDELSIGQRVYHDIDGNGAFDAGVDEPLGNVTVILRDADGSELARVRTDVNGTYVFDRDLDPFTDYFVVLPVGEASAGDVVAPFQPGLTTVDAPFTVTLGPNEATIAVTTGAFGSVETTLNFPLVLQFNIGNRLFVDMADDGANSEPGDGVQAPGDAESGVGGVTIELREADAGNGRGALVASTVTDANGFYLFNSLLFALLPNEPYELVVDLSQVVDDGSGLS